MTSPACVKVSAPARLDFSGGWSDTPPICHDRGGCVLNAAIRVNSRYPVQVAGQLEDGDHITLTSIDQGQQTTLSQAMENGFHPDPGQWYSLPWAALTLAGWHGGLRLTTFADLPCGSGLGTSSILGAAILQALAVLRGRILSPAELITQTLELERLLTTGGGWQDQAGSIFPGVKLLATEPGAEQVPTVKPVEFPSWFADKLILYYTGYQRLAKNILQNVVERYREGVYAVADGIEILKLSARSRANAILGGDYPAFGKGLKFYWETKKQFDPGSTTPDIEHLLRVIDRYCYGYSLMGAGGGGFLLIAAKGQESKGRIEDILSVGPKPHGARIYPFEVSKTGMVIHSSCEGADNVP